MHILIFPSKIWAKKYALYTAEYKYSLVRVESPLSCLVLTEQGVFSTLSGVGKSQKFELKP